MFNGTTKSEQQRFIDRQRPTIGWINLSVHIGIARRTNREAKTRMGNQKLPTSPASCNNNIHCERRSSAKRAKNKAFQIATWLDKINRVAELSPPAAHLVVVIEWTGRASRRSRWQRRSRKSNTTRWSLSKQKSKQSRGGFAHIAFPLLTPWGGSSGG